MNKFLLILLLVNLITSTSNAMNLFVDDLFLQAQQPTHVKDLGKSCEISKLSLDPIIFRKVHELAVELCYRAQGFKKRWE